MTLLEDVWARAKVVADREREAMETYLETAGIVLQEAEEEDSTSNHDDDDAKSGSGSTTTSGSIQPWDWRYVAEKVRKEKYDFDESLLKPYLSLESVRSAMFAVSSNLFDLEYIPLPAVVVEDGSSGGDGGDANGVAWYHPDVESYQVRKRDTQELVSIFVQDNYSRPYKSSGAWMSEYRSQTKNLPDSATPMEGIPIVSNNNNFAKGETTTFLSHDGTYSYFAIYYYYFFPLLILALHNSSSVS
jgi:peptidyl-dipeptidase Dcp